MPIEVDANTYPHQFERVTAKLYKKWWEIPSKPDYEIPVPATAYMDNGREVITDTAFHEYIVCDGELFKAMKLTTQGNLYEWENTVYLKGDGYGVFNDLQTAKKENKLAVAISNWDISHLTDAQVTWLIERVNQIAEGVVKLKEAKKCEL